MLPDKKRRPFGRLFGIVLSRLLFLGTDPVNAAQRLVVAVISARIRPVVQRPTVFGNKAAPLTVVATESADPRRRHSLSRCAAVTFQPDFRNRFEIIVVILLIFGADAPESAFGLRFGKLSRIRNCDFSRFDRNAARLISAAQSAAVADDTAEVLYGMLSGCGISTVGIVFFRSHAINEDIRINKSFISIGGNILRRLGRSHDTAHVAVGKRFSRKPTVDDNVTCDLVVRHRSAALESDGAAQAERGGISAFGRNFGEWDGEFHQQHFAYHW